MPIPAQRDLIALRETLREWLAPRLGDATDVEVGDVMVPGGSGFSNETFLADVAWRDGPVARTDSLVVRVQPTGHQIFLDADFELQYELLRVLDAGTDVPVAPTLWFEADVGVLGAPFFVMRRVDGRAPTDRPPYNEAGWLFDATEDERSRIWRSALDALVAVHRVPTETVSFLAKPELGPTGLDQLLTYWHRSFEWAARGRSHAVAEAAWRWLNAHLPAERPTALSWGDARIGNMLFAGCDVTAVLDWEMLSLGGHLVDLGWWLFLDDYHSLDVARLPGLGTREETIAVWQAGTGESTSDLFWYEIFAGFRFAVVMMRLSQLFESWGVKTSTADDNETDNPVTRLLAAKLASAS